MFPNPVATPRCTKCPKCGTETPKARLEDALFLCPSCDHPLTMPSRARIASWPTPAASPSLAGT